MRFFFLLARRTFLGLCLGCFLRLSERSIHLQQFVSATFPRTRTEDALYVLRRDDLALDEQLSNLMMSFRVLGQDLFGACHLIGDDTLCLLIDGRRRLVGVGFDKAVVVPTGRVIETDIFEFIAHAVVRDHGVGLLGSTLQVIEGTGRGLLQEELFRCTTAEKRTQFIKYMFLVGQLALFGQVPGSAQSHTARYDGHFDQRICPTEHPRNGCVSRLVESDGAFLLLSHDLVLALQSSYNTIDGVHEVLFTDFLPSAARCYQCRLVTYIGYIGAREARCLFA